MDNNMDEIVKIKNMPRLNDRLKLRIKNPSTMSEHRRREEARLHGMVGDDPSQVVETCRTIGEGSRVSSLPIGAREVDPEEYQRRFSPLNLHSVDIEENSSDLGDDGENEAGQFVDVLATCPSVVFGRATTGMFQRYSESSSSSVAEGKKDDIKMSWLLEDEAPGGPLNLELLRSFKSHVAYAFWVDPSKDRGVLRGHARESALSRLSSWTLSEKAQGFVDDSGLGHLTGCMMSQLDMPLLSAFLER
ncbi:hypothetical protein RND81_02G230300 [Saponaria officinalis]|uniref:Uncharacterized protein n=1 Tax=Saponaria officinalis TaxID=3572 RepID=A0AAW1MVV7_SAPOF